MDVERVKMVDEGERMDSKELSDNLINEKASRAGNAEGERRCKMVRPIREGIQVVGKWMNKSKSDNYGTQQTQGPT